MPKIENENPAPDPMEEEDISFEEVGLIDNPEHPLDDFNSNLSGLIDRIENSEQEIDDLYNENFPSAPVAKKNVFELFDVEDEDKKNIAKVCFTFFKGGKDLIEPSIRMALNSDKAEAEVNALTLSKIKSFYVDRTQIEGYKKGLADDEIVLNDKENKRELKQIKFFKKPPKDCKDTNKYNKVIVIKYDTKDKEDQEIIVDMDNNMIISNDNQNLYWHSKDKDKGGTGFDVDGENVYIVGYYHGKSYNVFAINNKIQKKVKRKNKIVKKQVIQSEYIDILDRLYKQRFRYGINIPKSTDFECMLEGYNKIDYQQTGEQWIEKMKLKILKLHNYYDKKIISLKKDINDEISKFQRKYSEQEEYKDYLNSVNLEQKQKLIAGMKNYLSELNKEILGRTNKIYENINLKTTDTFDDNEKKYITLSTIIKELRKQNKTETLSRINEVLDTIDKKNKEINESIKQEIKNAVNIQQSIKNTQEDELKKQFLEEMREKVNNFTKRDNGWLKSKTEKVMRKIEIKYKLGQNIDDEVIKKIIKNVKSQLDVEEIKNISHIEDKNKIYSNKNNFFNKIGEDGKHVFFLKYDAKNNKEINFDENPKLVKVKRTNFQNKYNIKEIILKTDEFFNKYSSKVISKENFERKQLQLKDIYQDRKISIVGGK